MKSRHNVGDRILVTRIDSENVHFKATIHSLENYQENDGFIDI